MRLQEAYSVLGIPPTSSEDDAKKKYRDLTKKYHPDVNKEPGAEDKFKQINQAYETIKKGEDHQPQQFHGQPGFNIHDFFGGMHKQQQRHNKQPQPIHLKTSISFKEAVFGVSKEFKYDRNIKCEDCEGQGQYTLHNGCQQCQGRGVTVTRQGNMIMQTTCGSCGGKRQTESCKKCSGTGGISSTSSISVLIPPGVSNGNTLRLEGMGNFVESVNNMFQSGDAFTDALIQINVEPLDNFSVKDQDVHTSTTISLLDALKGRTISVKTLDGQHEITIPKKTKNKDSISISNLGVARKGNQIVNINVEYPSDIKYLVKHLEKH